MRNLSATLEAAQKKPDRLPYVKATVHDLEQGIKRLSWQRLYTGGEPDNRHDVAFDSQGSMHRVRVDTGRSTRKLLGEDDHAIAASVAADIIWADKFTASSAGRMDLFRVKCSGAGNVKLALYADNAGSPGALLGAVNSGRAVAAGWNSIDFPPVDIAVGTVYWLAFIADAAVVGRWSDPGNSKKWKTQAYAGFSFPDPAPSWDGEFSGVPDLIAGWQAESAGSLLYYQKVATPGEGSDYSGWEEVADDCQGPCALAASGAKVYLFYRTTPGNVIWKRYSHNYGSSWSDAQLTAYADVLSMAACWWGDTDVVVCFCLTADEVRAVVLDSSDQSSSTHDKLFHGGGVTHVFQDTFGIGATYDAANNLCQVVLAAKELDSPYSHYDLWRTQLSAAYNWLAVQSFLSAPVGEGITCEYPDCHLPASPAAHESTRIIAVEKYSGTTAYTRPVCCHLVKGGYFSSAQFTEPRPFLDVSSLYGFRLASTASYWWLSRPDGVWRAPRAAVDPVDLSDDLISLDLSTAVDGEPGKLVLELDNAAGRYASPGSGSLAALRLRSELVLELGYYTTEGAETSEAGSFWIDSWEYSSARQFSTLKLSCLDGWGLAACWAARYQMRWNKDAVGPKTVWQLLSLILCRFGIRLTNTPPKAQSTHINSLYPDVTLEPGTRGDVALRRLLALVPDRLVFRGREAFTKNPLADEAASYEYDVVPYGSWATHPVLSAAWGVKVAASRGRAIGRDTDGNRVVEEALDWELLDLGVDVLRQDYDPNLQSALRAQERAEALLRLEELEAREGEVVVPVNVGQELMDVVTLTDYRCGIDAESCRVRAQRVEYERRSGAYRQTLALGAP